MKAVAGELAEHLEQVSGGGRLLTGPAHPAAAAAAAATTPTARQDFIISCPATADATECGTAVESCITHGCGAAPDRLIPGPAAASQHQPVVDPPRCNVTCSTALTGASHIAPPPPAPAAAAHPCCCCCCWLSGPCAAASILTQASPSRPSRGRVQPAGSSSSSSHLHGPITHLSPHGLMNTSCAGRPGRCCHLCRPCCQVHNSCHPHP